MPWGAPWRATSASASRWRCGRTRLQIRAWWRRTAVPLRAIREVRPGRRVGLTIRTDGATYRWAVLPGNARRIADAVVAALAATR